MSATAEVLDFVQKPVEPVTIRMSEDVGELFAALSKAQGAMSGAAKDSNNPFFKSKYADLHSVIETSRKPLFDNGLCVTQTTSYNDDGSQLCVLTTLGHSSNQWIQGKTPILTEKKTAQAMGSAITYARRYAWSAICGIAQMDDDGEAAKGSTKKEKPKQATGDKIAKALKSCDSMAALQSFWKSLTKEERAGHEELKNKVKDSLSESA